MKKIFIMAVAALCMGLTVTSCGDDDEPEKEYIYIGGGNNGGGTGDNGGGNGDNGGGDHTGGDNGGGTSLTGALKAFTFDGKYLTSITYSNGYSSNLYYGLNLAGNSIQSFVSEDGTYVFNSNAYTCTEDNGEMDKYYDFAVNNNGHITAFKNIWGNNNRTGGSMDIRCTYSGRNLSKVSIAGVDYEDEGENEYWNYDVTFTWSNGLITKINFVESWIEDGKQESETDSYTIAYGSTNNAHKQYTISFEDFFEDEIGLCLYGLLGDGPSKLPTSFSHYEEGEFCHTEDWTYTLNSNGTIATETRGSYTQYYNYGSSNARQQTRTATPGLDAERKSMKMHMGMHHKHAQK